MHHPPILLKGGGIPPSDQPTCTTDKLAQQTTVPRTLAQSEDIEGSETSILDIEPSPHKTLKGSGVFDYIISDHLPVYIIRKKERFCKEYTCSEDFCKLIERDPRWLQYWKAENVTQMWEIMYTIILDSLNELLSKRPIRICTNNPEWITKEALNSISLKTHLLEQV